MNILLLLLLLEYAIKFSKVIVIQIGGNIKDYKFVLVISFNFVFLPFFVSVSAQQLTTLIAVFCLIICVIVNMLSLGTRT